MESLHLIGESQPEKLPTLPAIPHKSDPQSIPVLHEDEGRYVTLYEIAMRASALESASCDAKAAENVVKTLQGPHGSPQS